VFTFGGAHFYGSTPHEVLGWAGGDFVFPFQDPTAVSPPSGQWDQVYESVAGWPGALARRQPGNGSTNLPVDLDELCRS